MWRRAGRAADVWRKFFYFSGYAGIKYSGGNSQPLFGDVMLNVIFGGFLYGLCIAIALRGNASTGGTDFIALYVSNKTGSSIWGVCVCRKCGDSLYFWLYVRMAVCRIFYFVSVYFH